MADLSDLFAAWRVPAPHRAVREIQNDARRVGPSDVYVAVRGRRFDGHEFVGDALARGAVAVVGEAELRLPVPYLRVPDARAALSRLAAVLHGEPSRRLYTIGVTGTKGKTTTTHLIQHLLQATGHQAGLLSTVGVRHGAEFVVPPGSLTTPEAPLVQGTLAEMVSRGARYAVLETSSHALALKRVADVHFDLAVWTHLEPEHLDFHGDVEAYFRAKAELVQQSPFAVLNRDCPYAMRLADHPHLTYGVGGGDFRASRLQETPHALSFQLDAAGFRGFVRLPLMGRFQVENALAALAAAARAGVALQDAVAAATSFGGVPGRMQVVLQMPIRAVVDFAHTPDSLTKALTTLRRTTRGRLLVVVGATGERDPRKRVPMGRIAVQASDLAIFTEDDTHGEPLAKILQALDRGARGAGGRHGRDYLLIPDRRRAIQAAARLARAGDTVLFAGKGHEHALDRGSETLQWDEAGEVRAAFARGRRSSA